MKAGRSVFISSAVFSVIIAAVYWMSSHHPGGSILLGFMGAAMVFVAGFMFVVQREANLSSDRKSVDYKETAGMEVGTFTLQTVWPFLGAVALFTLIVGAVWSPFVAGIGFIALLFVLSRLGAESNRT
ncbi:MAG: cytochrome c oxidase subunit 4 [Candidatus Baltobacteraceae bacterium]